MVGSVSGPGPGPGCSPWRSGRVTIPHTRLVLQGQGQGQDQDLRHRHLCDPPTPVFPFHQEKRKKWPTLEEPEPFMFIDHEWLSTRRHCVYLSSPICLTFAAYNHSQRPHELASGSITRPHLRDWLGAMSRYYDAFTLYYMMLSLRLDKSRAPSPSLFFIYEANVPIGIKLACLCAATA